MEFALKELSDDESDEADTPDEPLEVYDEKTVSEFYENQLAKQEEARKAKMDNVMTEISLIRPDEAKLPSERSPRADVDEKQELVTSRAEPEGENLDKESVVTTETIHELAKMHYSSTLRLSSLYQVGENAPHYEEPSQNVSSVKPPIDSHPSGSQTANIDVFAYQESSKKQNLESSESSFRSKSRTDSKSSHKSEIILSNAGLPSIKSEKPDSSPYIYNFDDSQYEEVQSTVQASRSPSPQGPPSPSPPLALHKGTLEVKIRSAKLSLNTRLADKMSPYVMLKFGPTLQKKTQICYSAGQNPVWENQKFEFSRVEENSLTFTVHDRDESGVDHLIGEVRLSLVDDENLSDSGGDQRMKESLKNGVVLLGSSGRKIKYSFGCGKSGLSTGSLGVSLKWWPE